MALYTQDARMMRLETPLGKDFLLINTMTVQEGISKLFSIEAEVLHEEKDGWKIPEPIDYSKILGQEVTIWVTQGEEGEEGRTHSGFVSEFALGWRSDRFSVYRMKIVPYVWAHTQKVECRIFQQKTVQSIVKEVFQGLESFVSWELDLDYKQRNYCVQYNESDFDFVARLLEEEGIYYYFEHVDGVHKMIISDRPQFSRTCPGTGELRFNDMESAQTLTHNIVHHWRTEYRIGPGLYSFRDHHIQQPGKKLATSSPAKFSAGDSSNWEVYEYPGGYARKYDGINPGAEKTSDLNNIVPDGKRTAQNASEVFDAGFKTVRAKTNCSSLIPGHLFKLVDHQTKDENGQYVVTSIRHKAAQTPPYDRQDGTYAGDEMVYIAEFEALAHAREGAVPFRPELSTPKPVMNGAQTAMVVGPSGEEIYTDEYGRIKVQFHWDREGKTDGADSCWLPVSQVWAGNGWGSMYIPRVGMEVIVHFLEGDPDQPFVSGCFYNPANMPPYKLPEEKTKSTTKTDSTKGGGGYNEIRFEDKKGSEQIFVHGQNDLDVRILNDRREWTGKDQHLDVQEDFLEKIGYGKNPGSHHLKIKKDEMIEVEGEQHLTVGINQNTKIGQTQTLEVGMNQGTKVGMNHSLEAGMAAYIKAGMSVVIEAGLQLTLKVGGNFIDINPAGITISGTPFVFINSPGGAAGKGTEVNVCTPTKPEEAAEADNDKPGRKMQLEKQSFERKKNKTKEDPKKKSWVIVGLDDEEGKPVTGEPFQLWQGDTLISSGTLNNKGRRKVNGIDPGSYDLTFPKLDKDAWE
jgi:type VI secretion system secreted protein VgrG